MRFGIGMNTDHTLEEVGQQFSVTRERSVQIEPPKALRSSSHPSRSRSLRRSRSGKLFNRKNNYKRRCFGIRLFSNAVGRTLKPVKI